MNAKSYEARIAELENKVAVLTSQNKKNGAEEDLYIRIFKLENKVAQLTAMNEALLSLQVDVATLKSTKRKIDLDCMDDSPPKKRKLDSQPTFRDEAFNSNEAVEVYTDGSCFNNGRLDACAGIGVYWGPDSEDNLSESLPGRQTNNRAEIYAAIRAIEQAIKRNIKNLIVHTDSQFLINCITKWIKSWRKNGWVKADGEKVINEEELQELDALLKDINVKWVHVDGHSGIPGNEAADKLAVKGAKGSQENKKNVKINKFGRKPRKSKKDLLQQKEEGWLNS